MATHPVFICINGNNIFKIDSSIYQNDLECVQILSNKRESVDNEECSTNIENFQLTIIKPVLSENRSISEGPTKYLREDSRVRLWEILGGNSPIPEITAGAVDECSTILKDIMEMEDGRNPLLDMLREIRGK